MFERDYLMRLLSQYFEAVRRSIRLAKDDEDPLGAADMLEAAIGKATDIDGDVLLSLAPESIASVMQVSGIDPKVSGFIARGLLLESRYLAQAGDRGRAGLREQQARAVAEAYGINLPDGADAVALAEGELSFEPAAEADAASASAERGARGGGAMPACAAPAVALPADLGAGSFQEAPALRESGEFQGDVGENKHY